MNESCHWCAAPAVDRHHITGRDHTRRYLDPGLIVPLCHDCHEVAGEHNRIAEIERVRHSLGVIETIAHRLRRLAIYMAGWAQATGLTLPLLLAEHLRAWAEELSAAAAEFEHAT